MSSERNLRIACDCGNSDFTCSSEFEMEVYMRHGNVTFAAVGEKEEIVRCTECKEVFAIGKKGEFRIVNDDD